MIKTYTSMVRAEVFDGSEEMVARYPIRHWESTLYEGGIGYALKVPSVYEKDETDNRNLLVGQYIVTTPVGKVINMWPNDFYDLFPEAEK